MASIGRWALYDCDGLSEVVLPSSVQNVGEQAFFGSDNLSNVLFRGKTAVEVKEMQYYPWGIQNTSIISAEL